MIKQIRHKLGGLLHRHRSMRALSQVLTAPGAPKFNIVDPESWKESISDPTGFYEDCVRYFHKGLDARLRDHREYFRDSGKGFGEDAFHVLWFLLCSRYQPASFLEIGVFRGQSLSLVSLLSKTLGFPCEVHGLSPFLPAGDSVSIYSKGVDYLEDTKRNFAHFELGAPILWKHFSTDPEARNLVSSKKWDCIYIDGNHDYEVAQADWVLCTENLNCGGIVVLDDSALGTGYRPPAFATGGHPGPSRLAGEIDQACFGEILRVGHNRVFQKII